VPLSPIDQKIGRELLSGCGSTSTILINGDSHIVSLLLHIEKLESVSDSTRTVDIGYHPLQAMATSSDENYGARFPQDFHVEVATAETVIASDEDSDNEKLTALKNSKKKRKRNVPKKRGTQESHVKLATHSAPCDVGDEADSKKRRSRYSLRKQAAKADKDEDYIGGDEGKAQKKKKTSTKSPGRGPEEDRICPHCQKVCSTKHGLKYHLGKSMLFASILIMVPWDLQAQKSLFRSWKITLFVDPRIVPTLGPLKKSANADSITNRIRTIIPSAFVDPWKSERVLTAIVFLRVNWVATITSVSARFLFRTLARKNSLKFHSFLPNSTEHKVCQTTGPSVGGSQGKPKNTWLGTLQPGSKFITQFGIVQVVTDDREVPTGTMPADIKKKYKEYQALRKRMDAKNTKKQDDIASLLRERRNKINGLYQQGRPNKSLTFQAYFDKENPKDADAPEKPLLRSEPSEEDPYAMDSFFPDRIVECFLVPDERQRFLSTAIDIPVEVSDAAGTGEKPTRMFLKRRVLTEAYNPTLPIYICVDCGRKFLSLAGMRYHCNGKVCVENNLKEGEKRAKRQEKVEDVRQQVQRGSRTRKSDRPDRRNRKAPRAMYPEVLISLGFQLIKHDMNFPHGENLPLINPADRIVGYAEGWDIVQEDGSNFVDPTNVVESLRREVVKQQRDYQLAAADQKHGSIYREVFKSLRFEMGTKRAKSLVWSRLRKRKLSKLPLPPPDIKPKPPIIDTRALADEIVSGRYPSMTRYTRDDHHDSCALCKDGGELICCDFCRNAEHFKCIRERFTVKAPEPEDFFVCHKCIQNVNSKRNRAEKRRLEKQQRDDERQRKEAVEERRLNPGIQSGMEYPYMADKAKEVNELIELLHDAQTRLKQAFATSKMNNIRRKAMGCFFSE
jgi:hypothetical protein